MYHDILSPLPSVSTPQGLSVMMTSFIQLAFVQYVLCYSDCTNEQSSAIIVVSCIIEFEHNKQEEVTCNLIQYTFLILLLF